MTGNVDAALAQRADDEREVGHVRRDVDEVGLLGEGLDARELRGDVCLALRVGVLEDDLAAELLEASDEVAAQALGVVDEVVGDDVDRLQALLLYAYSAVAAPIVVFHIDMVNCLSPRAAEP